MLSKSATLFAFALIMGISGTANAVSTNDTDLRFAQSEQTPPDASLGDPDPSLPDDGTSPDVSLGEIPDVETMELTPDITKRALDSYVMIKTKYESADLEEYDSLQDFVDQDEQGKVFEADVKEAGFDNVTQWNTAVTAVGFAYSALTDDPTSDIKQQISEIEADNTIAQDMKDRMIKSLNAMIPSENNRRVVEELTKDPAYAEKLKQLDSEEE